MTTIRNIYKQFTAWATRLLGNREEDAFMHARFKTALLYFAFMLVTLTIIGSILDYFVRDILAQEVAHGGIISPDELADRIQHIRLILRYVNLTIFAVGAYVLLGVTLRPIRVLVDRQKRFISNISHELRTPLTVMKAETELALRAGEHLTREQAVALLSKNLTRTDHVSRIIQFFLLLSDYRSPDAFQVHRVVNLETCLRSTVEHLTVRAHKKNLTIVLDIRSTSPVIRGNPIALEKLILNLLRNAILYTDPGGTIKASIYKESGKLILSVTDTGIGIKDEEIEKVFEPFYRGSNAQEGGTGLGLSIVKEVARIHDATLTIDSTVGIGTTISVIFTSSETIPT